MGAKKKASLTDQRRNNISMDEGNSCRDREEHSLQIFIWEYGQALMMN